MKNLPPGRNNSRAPDLPERSSAIRSHLRRPWSLRGCILDLWRLVGARTERPRRRPVRIIRHVGEISIADWAVRCDLCGKGAVPWGNPHRACMEYEAGVADLRPVFIG